MIELKDLPKKERVAISVTTEPFFISYTESRQFSKTYAVILKLFKNKYRKEVLTVLTGFIKAVRYDSEGVRFSLSSPVWAEANRHHKQKLSLRRTLFILDKLEEEGYLTIYKGYYFSPDDRMVTCLIMSDKMKDLIDPVLAKKFGTKRDTSSYLEIKSSEDKSLLNVKEFRGSSKVIRHMEKYNNLVDGADIRMLNEKTGEMVKCTVIYKKICLDSLDLAGRYFTLGEFQTMKSHLRKFITIKGESVTEVDFSNMFPRMLYTLEGITLGTHWDGYDIDGTHWISKDAKVLRDFLKEAYLSVLFSDTKDKAVKSVLSVANKNSKIAVDSKVKATEVVDLIMEKNKDISHYFFSEFLWAKLQHFESTIADYVINSFMKDGIVALSWHDSFVMQAQYQKKLLETMREGWYSVFGTYMNVKLKIDY